MVPDFIKLIDSYHGRSPLFLCSRQCLVCCQTHVPCLLQPVSLTRFLCNCCVNGRSPQGNHSQCKCIILSGWPSHTHKHTNKIMQPLASSNSGNPKLYNWVVWFQTSSNSLTHIMDVHRSSSAHVNALLAAKPCALLAPAGQLNEIPLQLRQRAQPSGKPQPMQVYHPVWLAFTHAQTHQ